MKNLAFARKIASLERQLDRTELSQHTLTQIDAHNIENAVRNLDVIVPAARRRTKYRGRGEYRKWTPQAILRVSFGILQRCALHLYRTTLQPHVAAQPLRRLRKKSQPPSTLMLHESVRSTARHYRSSTTHIEHQRYFVAGMYLEEVSKWLDALPYHAFINCEVGHDETEMDSRLGNLIGIRFMHMLHCRLLLIDLDDHASVHNLPCAPGWSEHACSADVIAALLAARMPTSFAKLHDKARHLNITLNTDSAKACKKHGRHIRACTKLARRSDGAIAGVSALHPGCQGHSAHHCAEGALRPLRLSTVVFSGCVLLTRMKYRRGLRKRCVQMLAGATPSYTSPPAVNVRFLEKTMELLEWEFHLADLTDTGAISLGPAAVKRQEARKRIANHLGASTFGPSGVIIERKVYCTLACHASFAEGIKGLIEDLDLVLWDRSRGVPVHNRWLKALPAWSAWNVDSKLGMADEAWKGVAQAAACNQVNSVAAAVLSEIGFEDDEQYKVRERNRFRVSGDLCKELNTTKLAVGSAILELCVSILGVMFLASKFAHDGAINITTFVVPSKSPAYRIVARISELLSNPQDEYWLVITGPHGWTQNSYRMASTSYTRLGGQIAMRLIEPFKLFPWALALLPEPDAVVPHADKLFIGECVARAKGCDFCGEPGLTKHIVALAPATAQEVLDDAQLLLAIQRPMKACCVTNLNNEDRFSRSRKHSMVSQGHAPFLSTKNCYHVLGECSAWHREAIERHRRGPGYPMP